MRTATVSACLLLAIANPASAACSADEAAIRAVESRQAEAWNAHDATAYARLFTPDADVVNVLGWHWTGRTELEQKLANAFAFVFAHSELHITDVSVRFLTDKIAVAHVRWSMTGSASPDGSGSNVPQTGIQTQILSKAADQWLITAFQNTNAVPERAFPKPR